MDRLAIIRVSNQTDQLMQRAASTRQPKEIMEPILGLSHLTKKLLRMFDTAEDVKALRTELAETIKKLCEPGARWPSDLKPIRNEVLVQLATLFGMRRKSKAQEEPLPVWLKDHNNEQEAPLDPMESSRLRKLCEDT